MNRVVVGEAIAGSFLSIIAWILDATIHLKIPDEVATAITVVICFAVGFFITRGDSNGQPN